MHSLASTPRKTCMCLALPVELSSLRISTSPVSWRSASSDCRSVRMRTHASIRWDDMTGGGSSTYAGWGFCSKASNDADLVYGPGQGRVLLLLGLLLGLVLAQQLAIVVFLHEHPVRAANHSHHLFDELLGPGLARRERQQVVLGFGPRRQEGILDLLPVRREHLALCVAGFSRGGPLGEGHKDLDEVHLALPSHRDGDFPLEEISDFASPLLDLLLGDLSRLATDSSWLELPDRRERIADAIDELAELEHGHEPGVFRVVLDPLFRERAALQF